MSGFDCGDGLGAMSMKSLFARILRFDGRRTVIRGECSVVNYFEGFTFHVWTRL